MDQANESGSRELAQYAYGLGMENKEIKRHEFGRSVNAAQIALIPLGQQAVDLKPFLPDRPERKQVGLKFYDAQSFVAYVNEQKSEFTRIFASIAKPPYMFKAVIDWHEPAGGKADWCEHQVTLELALSEQFRTWKEQDGNFMSQTEFAEFLKDNRFDILEPSGAEVLQLVMDLEATSEARCAGKVRDNDGVNLSFVENVNTSVGGQKVTVPNTLRLKMPFFENLDAVEITADFKFRTIEGKMFFGYRMLGIEKMLRDAVKAAQVRIAQETELPVYV